MERKKIQLFFLPYAGGTAESFRELETLLGEEIETRSLEYAGHGRRAAEPFYASFDELAEDMTGKLMAQRERQLPFALFGYSMGSLAAYEVIRRLEGTGQTPRHLFLAAHEAPDLPGKYETFRAYAGLSDEAFMERMTALGGYEKYTPGLLKNRFFRKLLLDPLRRDYELLADYPVRGRHPLPCPLTVFYAPADTPEKAIHSWDAYISQKAEYVPLGETHFFIRKYAARMAQIIQSRLAAVT